MLAFNWSSFRGEGHREWISTRLKASIQHEYDQNIEVFKAQLNATLQDKLGKIQLDQMRTSLFFDHQRIAFSGMLNKIAETRISWIEIGFDPEEGLCEHVPTEKINELNSFYLQNQLFFDRDCLFAIDLLFDVLRSSLPEMDAGGGLSTPDPDPPFSGLVFLEERIAELFREKIGICSTRNVLLEVALFSGIRVLNHFRFEEVGLPIEGPLKLKKSARAEEAISIAKINFSRLNMKLEELRIHLGQDGGWSELGKNIGMCLEIFDSVPREQV